MIGDDPSEIDILALGEGAGAGAKKKKERTFFQRLFSRLSEDPSQFSHEI